MFYLSILLLTRNDNQFSHANFYKNCIFLNIIKLLFRRNPFTQHILRNIGGPREILGVPGGSEGHKGSWRLEGVLGVPDEPGVPGSSDWVPLFHHAVKQGLPLLCTAKT